MIEGWVHHTSPWQIEPQKVGPWSVGPWTDGPWGPTLRPEKVDSPGTSFHRTLFGQAMLALLDWMQGQGSMSWYWFCTKQCTGCWYLRFRSHPGLRKKEEWAHHQDMCILNKQCWHPDWGSVGGGFHRWGSQNQIEVQTWMHDLQTSFPQQFLWHKVWHWNRSRVPGGQLLCWCACMLVVVYLRQNVPGVLNVRVWIGFGFTVSEKILESMWAIYKLCLNCKVQGKIVANCNMGLKHPLKK